jgi:hypothetical protein
MATRLHFIFDGGPDDEVRTLREVADGRNKFLTFGHLARWVAVSKDQNIWAMEVDVVNLERRPIVALCTTKQTAEVIEVSQQLSDNGSIVLQRQRDLVDVVKDGGDAVRHEKNLQFDRINLADRLFVVNELIDDVGNDVIDAVNEEIDYAGQLKKRVQYLRYDSLES